MRRSFLERLIPCLVWMCLLVLMGGCGSSSSSGYLTPFSPDGTGYNGGKWSPDGHWFAATQFAGDYDNMQLFSSKGQLISSWHSGCDLGGNNLFSWTPDGRLTCFADGGMPILKLMQLDPSGQIKYVTSLPLPLAPHTLIDDSQWNPQQSWLATIADKIPGEDSPTLYLTDAQGHNLISPISVGADELAWSPDGTALALTKPNGDILLLKVQPVGNETVHVTPWRQLAAGASDIGDVVWSPGGRWLLCRHASYNSEDYLFLLATDGSGKQVKLTSSTTDGQLDYPAWSPDGKQLIVSQIALSGNVLMKLDMVSLLKAKGVTP